MENILIFIAILAVCIGTFFSLTGVLGYIRFPDVYTGLHATAKVSVFGAMFLMVAAISWTPLTFGKGLVLITLLLISGPVISHALASAAYRIKVPLKQAVRDDLNHRENNNTQKNKSELKFDHQE
jgi:multicomponent Na+:H+ antiporter subunit G